MWPTEFKNVSGWYHIMLTAETTECVLLFTSLMTLYNYTYTKGICV